MRAGQLRHQIIIQQETLTNAGGLVTTAWDSVASVRASAEPLSGVERWAAQQVQDETTLAFRIRHLAWVTQRMRVLYGYKAYNITAVLDVRGRAREMFIQASIYPKEYSTFSYALSEVSVNHESATIEWTTDFYASTKLQYKRSVDGTWITVSEYDVAPRVLAHSVSLTGLTAETAYDYRIYSENEAGWTPGYSATYNFTTAAEVGGEPEEIIMSGLTWTGDKDTITASYTVNMAVKCTIFGRVAISDPPLFESWYINAAEHGTHSHSTDGLAHSTRYHVRIELYTTEGHIKYYPSPTGYYVVDTADLADIGGGYKFTEE